MTFGLPLLLLLLLGLVPVAVALGARARWRRAAIRRLVAAAPTRAGGGSRALKLGLVLAALTLIAVAAARPQRGERRILLPREGTDVMLVLDVSLSMLADDVQPNRFAHAKSVLDSLLGRLQGDRVGLVVFAGTAGVRFPLTTDIEAARELIRTAAMKEGGLSAGTGLGDAIRVATSNFPQEDQTRSKVMLIVSDGEDTTGAPLDALRTARERGIIVSTLGVGTEAGGTLVLPRPTGTPGQRTDSATGQPAVSRRDEGMLRQIARDGRGRYYDGNGDDPAAQIAEDIGRLARSRFESQEGRMPVERFQPFGALALLFLVLEFLRPEGQRRRGRLRRRLPRDERAGQDAA